MSTSPATEPDSVIVLGATGFLGGAFAEALVAQGTRVYAVGRSADKLAALRERVGSDLLSTHPVELTDDVAAARTAAEITDAGGAALAIAALGGWYVEEPTLELPMKRWQDTLTANLTTHFVAAKAFSPALRGERPTYVALNGIASHYPCEGSVAVSVTGAGQRMLIDVLAAEATRPEIRYGEVVVDTPILSPGNDPGDEPAHTPARVLAGVHDLVERHPGGARPYRVELGEQTADLHPTTA